jgi:hypothetical protein
VHDQRTRVAVAVAAIVATGLAFAGPADAQNGAHLAAIKTAGEAAITARQSAISAATSEIAGLTDLGSDQATLTSRLSQASAGLTALDGKIQVDTTAAAAAADDHQIYAGYRIYALVLPAAYLTAAADRIVNEAVPRFTSLSTKLAAAISASGDTSLQPTLDDLNANVAAAQGMAGPLPATLAALTPQDYNADPAVVATNRARLISARGDLKVASADAHHIVDALPSK